MGLKIQKVNHKEKEEIGLIYGYLGFPKFFCFCSICPSKTSKQYFSNVVYKQGNLSLSYS